MTDISDILETKLKIAPEVEHNEYFTSDYESAEKLKALAKEGKKVIIGHKDYPAYITNVNISGSPGSTTVTISLDLVGITK